MLENILTFTVNTPVGIPGSPKHTPVEVRTAGSRTASHIVELAVGAPHGLRLLPRGRHQRLEDGLGEDRAVRDFATSQVTKEVILGGARRVVTLKTWIIYLDFQGCF